MKNYMGHARMALGLSKRITHYPPNCPPHANTGKNYSRPLNFLERNIFDKSSCPLHWFGIK